MSTMTYSYEIKPGLTEAFTYQLNDDPIEELEANMARVVGEYQYMWLILRNNKGQDVDLALRAYDELSSTNPHLAISMVAWFLAERTVSMNDRRRRGIKGSVVELVDDQKTGEEYFNDKPNVKIIYERSKNRF